MVRVLAVADSDSYLKWTAATLAAMPSDWHCDQVVLVTPIAPSGAQIAAAGGSDATVLTTAQLTRRLLRERPDVLLLGCTGPAVQAVLVNPWLRRGRRRPVLVTGLPGISVPATSRAVQFRSACDLFVLHSHRERAEFTALGRTEAPHLRFGLARLPFLAASSGLVVVDEVPPRSAEERRDVVFAAQAKVPSERSHRRAVLLALAETPGRSAVVKLRAGDGEQQTHRELWSYPQLWAELVAEGLVVPGSVRFSTGAMSAALASAAGFVTVSSTAALEALATGVPVLVVSDFGVSAEQINLVFEGSDCLGTLADLRAGRFFTANNHWRTDNYFHRADDSDWLDLLCDLVSERATVGLPPTLQAGWLTRPARASAGAAAAADSGAASGPPGPSVRAPGADGPRWD